MGLFAVGEVVTLPFPYTDLSASKFRPVLLLASAGREDWIVCQITSNPFADPHAVVLTADRFAVGGLRHTSYLRPSKLFTAHESLVATSVGSLTSSALESAVDSVILVLRPSRP